MQGNPFWLPLAHREPPDFDGFEEDAVTVERPRRDYTTDEVAPPPYYEAATRPARARPCAAVIVSRVLAVLTLLVVALGMAMIAGW